MDRQELLKTLKKIDSRKECLHPKASNENCNHFINAHTIQKEGALRNISKKGKVISLDFNLINLLNDGKPKFKKIGISDASTLNIFCNRHDTELFRPIENFIFTSTLHQIFLYSYRAFSREVRGKKAYLEFIPILINDAKKKANVYEKIVRLKYLVDQEKLVKHGINDFNTFKKKYDHKLTVNDFTNINYYYIEFENKIPIVSCGATSPEMDFHGNDVRSIKYTHETPEIYSFNLECTKEYGFALFSWIGNQKHCTKLIKSFDILTDFEKEHALFRYLLEYYENLFIDPNWFDRLTQDHKDYIIKRALSADGRTRNEKSLLEDGKRIVNWKIREIKTNLSLNII